MRIGRDGRHRGRGRGPVRVLATLGVLLVLAALALVLLDRGDDLPLPSARARPAALAHRGIAPEPAPEPVTADPASAGRPVRLVVPSLGVSAPVTPVELDGTALVPPADPQVVGWWRSGGVPGAARGTTVLAGHTVHTGGGVFDRLADLRRGDMVRVVTHTGVVEYAVRSVTVYSRADLAGHAPAVFSPSARGRLALVTCDDWNGTGYDSNAVALAYPVVDRVDDGSRD